jgi:hypothetical protein
MPMSIERPTAAERRALLVRIWTKALLMLGGLVLAAFLYFSGGIALKLVAWLVVLPGAVVGWRELSGAVRSGKAAQARRNPQD